MEYYFVTILYLAIPVTLSVIIQQLLKYYITLVIVNLIHIYHKYLAIVNLGKIICAPSDDSDQHGHPPSLTRVFAVHSVGSYKDPMFLHANGDASDQTGWMPMLI